MIYIHYGRGKLSGRDLLMTYSYKTLWKMLIDENINKTEMKKQAGFTTNMPVKIVNGESVLMKIHTKNCAVFGCGLDDITEIKQEVYSK